MSGRLFRRVFSQGGEFVSQGPRMGLGIVAGSLVPWSAGAPPAADCIESLGAALLHCLGANSWGLSRLVPLWVVLLAFVSGVIGGIVVGFLLALCRCRVEWRHRGSTDEDGLGAGGRRPAPTASGLVGIRGLRRGGGTMA